MRAGLRLGVDIAGGGAWLVPAAALAQDATPPATTNRTPATDAIGPRELQNFSLPGTRRSPADSRPRQPRRRLTPAPSRARKRPRPAAATRRADPAPDRTSVPRRRHSASGDRATANRPRFAGPPRRRRQPRLVARRHRSSATTTAARPPTGRLDLVAAVAPLRSPWAPASLAALAASVASVYARRRRSSTSSSPRSRPGQRAASGAAPTRRAPPPPHRARTGARSRCAGSPRHAATSGIVASRLRPALELGMQPAPLHRRRRPGHDRIRARAVQCRHGAGPRGPRRGQPAQRRRDPGPGARGLLRPAGRARASGSTPSRR